MPLAPWVASTFSAVLVIAGFNGAHSQSYPTKPIRALAIGPGGGSDFPIRAIAPRLSSLLGQQVIIDNRGGLIPGEIVFKASPDGYTVMVAGNAFWNGPLLQKTIYDPVKDFSPITLVSRAPSILVVHPSLPVTSVKELIALAKAKPGTLNYGSGNLGSSSHLGPELFKLMAGVDIVRINYASAGPAINALIANEVQLMIPNASGVGQLVKSGRLKALAVTSPKPSVLLPDLPTVAASGLPGYESMSYIGIFAPAKAPEAIIRRLNQDIARVLREPDIQEKFLNIGVEAVSCPPEELAATMKSEMTRVRSIIKSGGVKAD